MAEDEKTIRRNSEAYCGGAFGDEGKGRIVDKRVSDLIVQGPVVVYRDNGGANAGHTVEFGDRRIALHQLPSGVFVSGATVVLGKEMVIHPGDLAEEIEQVREISGGEIKSTIMIDEYARLSLDTHRAFEAVSGAWNDGGKAATGRGISAAYSDVLQRFPLEIGDLVAFDEEKLVRHYRYYEAILRGLGANLAEVEVPALNGRIRVGSLGEFMNRLKKQREVVAEYAANVIVFLEEKWPDASVPFVFEKAQAIGLDRRWGVYPDITASDTTFGGIDSSTGGIIKSRSIESRVGVIKATYMSSVGTRRLPTMMEEDLAGRIREKANEYGATTHRPRDIAYLDLVAINFFARQGAVNGLALTHLDISYPDVPIKVCLAYLKDGKRVPYYPDQRYLEQVEPVYVELPPWSGETLPNARRRADLPREAADFLNFISVQTGLPILMVTTGPKREQGIMFDNN